jgi:hypothetical protein
MKRPYNYLLLTNFKIGITDKYRVSVQDRE